MKSCIWKITIYLDDEKTKMLFEKEYKNTDEVIKDFNFSKTFLYNCCRKDKYRNDSRKLKHTNSKYNRMKIMKISKRKDGDIINYFNY